MKGQFEEIGNVVRHPQRSSFPIVLAWLSDSCKIMKGFLSASLSHCRILGTSKSW